jgi:hypothetical protein
MALGHLAGGSAKLGLSMACTRFLPARAWLTPPTSWFAVTPLRSIALAALTISAVLGRPSKVAAQERGAVLGAAGGIVVGSDLEEYLRYLQTMGKAPMLPWGVRGFSPEIVDSITTIAAPHPWRESWLFKRDSIPAPCGRDVASRRRRAQE